MGKRRRKKATPSREPPASAAGGSQGETREQAIPRSNRAGGPATRSWLRSNRSDLRFLLIFGLQMAVYYAVTTTSFAKDEFFPWYLRLTTQASDGLMHVCGYDDVAVQGNVLSSSRGSITVERGCDAIAPTALFVSAVIASPAPLSLKLPAVIGGILVLIAVNVIRIVTLFLTRIHWPEAFDVIHLDVWQAMFIFLAIVLWAFWASWATRRQKGRSDASA